MKIIYLNHFNDIDMTDKSLRKYTIYMEKPLTYNSQIALVWTKKRNIIELENFHYLLDVDFINDELLEGANRYIAELGKFSQENLFKWIFYYAWMDNYLDDEMLDWTVEQVIKMCLDFDPAKHRVMNIIDTIDWQIGAFYRWYNFEDNTIYVSRDKEDKSLPILKLKEIIDNNKKLVISHGYKSMELLYEFVIFNLKNNRAYTGEEIKGLLVHFIIKDNQD